MEERSSTMAEAPAGDPQVGSPADAGVGRRRRPRKRGRVTVFETWCKGCGLCIAFCPQKVLEGGPDGRTVVAHEERCVACNWCYEHCPDCAITVEAYTEEEEPAERAVAEVAR